MACVKVPPENHPKLHAALPKDERVESMKMFGGVKDRAAALKLPGAAPFDPMGCRRRPRRSRRRTLRRSRRRRRSR